MSYLADDERAAIPNDMLPGPPVTIANVGAGPFAIARYSGSITIGGCRYAYIHAANELIRYDVLYWVDGRRRNQKEAAE